MKRMRLILIFVTLLLIAQRTYMFHAAIPQEKRLAELMKVLSQNNAESNIRKLPDASRWVGIWYENNDHQAASTGDVLPPRSALENVSSIANPDSSSTIGTPVFDQISLAHGWQGIFELHECVSGDDSCQSGGMIVLLSPEGEEILSGTVTVSDGSVHYDLDWAGQIKLSEEEKLEIIRKAIESSTTLETGRLRSALRQIYGYESVGDLTEDALRKELFQGLLRRVLDDRNSSKRELSSRIFWSPAAQHSAILSC